MREKQKEVTVAFESMICAKTACLSCNQVLLSLALFLPSSTVSLVRLISAQTGTSIKQQNDLTVLCCCCCFQRWHEGQEPAVYTAAGSGTCKIGLVERGLMAAVVHCRYYRLFGVLYLPLISLHKRAIEEVRRIETIISVLHLCRLYFGCPSTTAT